VEDAYLNFTSKPPFESLDPDVLQRYVEDGFEVVPAREGGDGSEVRLRCDRDDEAEVYEHGFANGAFARLDEVACPTVFAFGGATKAFGLDVMSADAARVPRATVEPYPGLGHFGPLERPAEVAAGVARALGAHDGTPPS
jgi:pimeloyl-ACP methyl ester carboxylesterase